VIGDVRHTDVDRGLDERPLLGVELLGRMSTDRDRPFAAVPGVVEVGVSLEPAEERKEVLEAPLAHPVAARPPVVVGGCAPYGEAAVGRRAAADQTGPRQGDTPTRRVGLRHVAPVVTDRRLRCVAHIRGEFRDTGMVGARLDQHHGTGRVLAQPRGEHAARRPTTDHHHVDDARHRPRTYPAGGTRRCDFLGRS
jgi:hypothetical protein